MTFITVTEKLAKPESFANHVELSLPYRSARAIRDPEVVAFIEEFDRKNKLRFSLGNDDSRVAFLDQFPAWVLSSRANSLLNFDLFKYVAFTHGTIQSFDAFYAKHHRRRFRCFKGEFMYHRASWRSKYAFSFIEDAPIERNDAVVISLPFSDSGGSHPLMHEVLQECNRFDVPVLLDCAYMNICIGMELDFDQPCIETVAFSLSKTFYGMDKMRVGVRFKKEYDDDFVDIMNSAGMVSQYSCCVGLDLINAFDADFNQMKYRQRQIEACLSLGVEASSCVIFGLGDEKWAAYNRGGACNRICVNSLIESP